MNREERIKREIASVARKILSGQLGILEGSRSLAQLSGRLQERNDDLFAAVLAVESETDELPLGPERSNWSEEALSRKDADAEDYVIRVRDVVLQTCEKLVEAYSGKII